MSGKEESSNYAATAEEEAVNQGFVLPEGKIMPNTVFVGGIDITMDEIEIRDFFTRFGNVKEVKIITDRTGVSKGYGFISFSDEVDVQKIVKSQISFHGKKLKLGPAIRKICTYVQPRPVVLSHPTPFHHAWNNQNADSYIQHSPIVSPITQYVQACPYPSSPPMAIQQIPVGCQQPGYFQVSPQWPADQRSYMFPTPAFTFNYHCCDMDPNGGEPIPREYPIDQTVSASGANPQKRYVEMSTQTIVSCLFDPANKFHSFVSQEDYLKDNRVHHLRRRESVIKRVSK
ncbi:hypothetical protein XELAEV_18031029mg [Xenopus laevis]|uniref:DAZ-like protein n=2 Tax=Xenopus laevis TaxID=8355 RepID=B7ZS12_XENLA|nr:DAZ-like protein [Xenopus laevis]AAI70361.1 DAZ-like protein [Xenopus laevis]OCT75842.1 hypothetical protein XELAEV_18031029mg [Xenopus laevis]